MGECQVLANVLNREIRESECQHRRERERERATPARTNSRSHRGNGHCDEISPRTKCTIICLVMVVNLIVFDEGMHACGNSPTGKVD